MWRGRTRRVASPQTPRDYATSCRDSPDPDATGGGFAKVNGARAAWADFKGHGFVVFAAANANAGARAHTQSGDKGEEVWISLLHAKNFHAVPSNGLSEGKGAPALAQMMQAANDGNAVGTAAFAAKAMKEQIHHVIGDAMFKALGFFVGPGPVQADDVGEQFFGEAVAKGEMFGACAAAGS